MADDEPKRLTVWASARTDLIRASWLTWLLLNNAFWCVIVLLGLAGVVSPTLSLGGTGLLLVTNVLIWFGFSISGALGGTFAWFVFVFSALASGPTPAYVALVLSIDMAGWHVLVLANVLAGLDSEREIKQRRN